MSQEQPKTPVTFYMGMGADQNYMKLMTRAGFKLVPLASKADISLFTGGSDVNPLFYGEEPRPETQFNMGRDAADIDLFRISKDKLKIGICRGGQFLNVMNGGKMWQHVDNHGKAHYLTDQFNNQTVLVSSTHHQMMKPAHNAVVVALAREASYKYTDCQLWKIKDDGSALQAHLKKDYEVLWYPHTRSLCFQPHPEFPDAESCRDYFYAVLRRVIDGSLDREVAALKAKG